MRQIEPFLRNLLVTLSSPAHEILQGITLVHAGRIEGPLTIPHSPSKNTPSLLPAPL